uniref:Putative secreted protein n=1 Tax=Ixodes scapularis TaxID=6945 RepID=A0A4D5RZS8_IXOSC
MEASMAGRWDAATTATLLLGLCLLALWDHVQCTGGTGCQMHWSKARSKRRRCGERLPFAARFWQRTGGLGHLEPSSLSPRQGRPSPRALPPIPSFFFFFLSI